eukprot:5469547-Prymnesium_polylepis.2
MVCMGLAEWRQCTHWPRGVKCECRRGGRSGRSAMIAVYLGGAHTLELRVGVAAIRRDRP